MNYDTNLLNPLIAQFHSAGRLRVWSLIITIFGDAIQPRGGRVSTARLQIVLERLQIEPGAFRTAMSRLAKEGWVKRERVGRSSFYELDSRGVEAFGPASARIYGTRAKRVSDGWMIGVGFEASSEGRTANVEAAKSSGGIPAGSNIHIWPAKTAPDAEWFRERDMLSVKGEFQTIPKQLVDQLAPDQQKEAYLAIMNDFSGFSGSQLSQLSPLDAFAARSLLIHRWRRVALRCPNLPVELSPHGWPAEDCREFVAKLYKTLLPESEAWLNTPVKGDSALPTPNWVFHSRFGGL